jgi:hypothetical protein
MVCLDKIAAVERLKPVTKENSDSVFATVFSLFREQETFTKDSGKIKQHQTYNTIYNLWTSK